MPAYANASPWLGLLAGAALMACNPGDNANPIHPGDRTDGPGPAAAGKTLYEEKLTPTATYAIFEEGDGLVSQIMGHADKDRAIIDALQQSIAGKSFVDGHRALQALKTDPIPTPALLAELDRRAEAAARTAVAAPVRMHGPAPEAKEPAPRLESGPLAKKAVEPTWDWVADAAWFRGQVRIRDQRTSNVVTHFATNVTIDDATPTSTERAQWGFNHFAMGMNASHVNTGRMQAWKEPCDIFGFCSGEWGEYKVTTLAPRVFLIRDYRNTFFENNRRFRVEGTRVHLGIKYNPS